MHKLYWFL